MDVETKSCRLCREEIKGDARYCIHCNNFQDWRGRIGISATLLSLLVALVSVLTTAVPIILTAATPKNSDFRFSIQTVSQSELSAFVSNSGVRPGTINPGAHVTITESGGKERKAMLSAEVIKQEVAQPGTSVLRRYKLLPLHFKTVTITEGDQSETVTQVDDTFMKSGRERSCVVRFSVTDFLGASRIEAVPFDCGKLATMKFPVTKSS